MDNLSPESRHKNMQNIRSKGTLPERIFAKELRKRHIYYNLHYAKIIGKPDFVFKRAKLAVFIDSDFWHFNPERCIIPESNKEYWVKKLNGNKSRDERVSRELNEKGWQVIRFWEYDVKKNIDEVMKCFESKLKKCDRI